MKSDERNEFQESQPKSLIGCDKFRHLKTDTRNCKQILQSLLPYCTDFQSYTSYAVNVKFR